jgi:hypothetical protein
MLPARKFSPQRIAGKEAEATREQNFLSKL